MHESVTPPVVDRRITLMKDGHPNSVVFMIGARGSGKTQLMADEINKRQRFVIFDTRKDYDHLLLRAIIVQSPQQMLDAMYQYGNSSRIIYRLSVLDKENFDLAMKMIYLFQERNSIGLAPLVISVDELNRFAETNEWGEHFETIITSGRDYKIDGIFGCQWWGKIPGWVRDTATEVYAFKTLDPSSVDRLSIYGFYSDDLRELKPYHALYYGKGDIRIINVIGERKK